MRPRFFTIGHNSAYNSGMPEIQMISVGLFDEGSCKTCGTSKRNPSGDLTVTVGPSEEARSWPDIIACGDYPCFVVSGRAVEEWRSEDIGSLFIGGKVLFTGPLPERLQGHEPPKYFWLDGRRMLGAQLDFDASGFAGAWVCSTCGCCAYDVGATYDRQRAGACPYVFVEETWNGTNLFTTDLSPAMFFCTDAVVECARKHRLTNFRFTPVEAGGASWSQGIDYLGKQWPPYSSLRPSEGKTINQWVEQLRNPSQRYKARVALLDLGKDAAPMVPSLISMLHDNDEAVRREAALLLSALEKMGVPLGAEGEAAARQHEEWFQKTIGR